MMFVPILVPLSFDTMLLCVYPVLHVLVGLHQRNCQIGGERALGVRTKAVLSENGDEMAAPGKTSSHIIN